jgi:hydrogenase maturation protease
MLSPSLILVGTGQSLRSDDAIGLIAVRQWRMMYPETAAQISVEIIENPGINLLDLIRGYETALIVDAVKSGVSPGTILRVSEDQISAFGLDSKSAHGWGIIETLHVGRRIYPSELPQRIVLLGMEVGSLDIGETLSDENIAKLPDLVQAIQVEVNRLAK